MTTASNITERAMLVDLTVRRWGGYKSDKEVNREVADNHQSDVTMGNYAKRLVDRKVAFKHLDEVHSRATTIHFRYTLPWMDSGQRILSSNAYLKYTDEMRGLKNEWDDAVDHFCRDYPTFINEARISLGGLFREKEYPTVAQVKGKFSLNYHFANLPSAGDFRVELDTNEQEAVKADIEANVQAGLRQALRSVAERIAIKVGHMAERLRAYSVTDDGKTGVFRDSLLGNISDLVDLLPVLNITGDVFLDEITERMQKELLEFSVDTLRFDEDARNKVASAAEDILAKVKEFAI